MGSQSDDQAGLLLLVVRSHNIVVQLTMLNSYSLFLLVFTISLTSCSFSENERDQTGCPKKWEQRCSCGFGNYRQYLGRQKVFISNCTNTNFTNPEVLEFTPKETEVLIFNGNHFETLPTNLFGIWSEHDKLKVIDLSNNGIKDVQGKLFHKITNIRRLILNHNDLSTVSSMNRGRLFSSFVNLEELHLTNAFTEQMDSKWYLTDLKQVFLGSNSKIKKLHLEQNGIWDITNKDMFCDLPELMDLHLGDNQLSDVNFSLDCIKNLRYVDLEYNKIKNLKNETLEKLDKVFQTRMIDLHRNPFTCDCHMIPLFNWLKVTKARLVNKREMRCYDGYPAYNAGKRIENRRIQDLKCNPRTTNK